MRPFHLLIDIGNTFLKWGLFQPAEDGGARENRLESGHLLLEEIPALPSQFAKFPAPARIVISNVAGTRVRAATIRVLEVWPDAPAPYWLVPQDEQCGVRNSYRNPAQLGSDRWAALIGARHLMGARAAMVVVCGTATTIDFLSPDGFRTSSDLAAALLSDSHVAVTPGEAFDAPGFLRISYATSMKELERGSQRILEFLATRVGARAASR